MATIRNMNRPADTIADWGTLTWLCNSQVDPEAQMTFGIVCIKPGHRNPRHYHPNCEELIFVMSGECDHSVGAELHHLKEGDMLRVPQGVAHYAFNTGESPVRMVVVYSSPDRQTVGE